MTKRTMGIVLLSAAGLVGLLYWLYKAGKLPGQTPAAPTDPIDDAAFNQLVAFFKQHADEGALSWLLDIYERRRSGMEPTDQSYYINGKLTKAGAFMATYAGGYFGYGYPYQGISEKDFNDQIYQKFYAFKTQYILNQNQQ